MAFAGSYAPRSCWQRCAFRCCPKRVRSLASNRFPQGVLAGVLGLGALLFEVAGVELSMGGEPPGRVIGWFQFGFWLLLMSVAVATLPAIKNSVVLERVRSVCLLLLAVSLLSSHTFRVAVMDMRSLAPAWRQTSVSRLSRHSGPVQLAQLPAKPQLFIRQAVTRDPSCWVNRCMANYIGATTVTASASREACPSNQGFYEGNPISPYLTAHQRLTSVASRAQNPKPSTQNPASRT